MRRRFLVRGTVQGVGFRPFVFRAAVSLGLRGFVQNETDGVVVEVEGSSPHVEALARLLVEAPPPQAVVEDLSAEDLPPAGLGPFEIRESVHRVGTSVRVSPDLAPCAACLGEVGEAGGRRFGYPFANCTDCGPRYSIVESVPYDRAATTMQVFAMCALCSEEYADPTSRRFHAEPNACPECGPRAFVPEKPDGPGIDAAVAAILQGDIVAVKGVSGFHLACDATNQEAVSRLRRRKHRPDKPFAVMFRSLEALLAEVEAPEAARRSLTGSRRPIVLLPRRPPSRLAPGIAPGLRDLGVFLPGTPLHQLILDACQRPLVMTSGNLSEEPVAASNEEGLNRLSGIADRFLMHDREIHARQDDSVTHIVLGEERVLRRARGFVPEAIDLGFSGPDVLAVGADLKNAFCLASGGAATMGPHIGDLESLQSQEFFAEARNHLEALLQVTPAMVAHDLHPGYHSTAMARAIGLPQVPVQHHHAHIASCLADNGRNERVIGVAWDGTGYGTDGEFWGGEFLIADFAGFERAGFLRPVLIAGGDAAAREPWRMALSYLMEADLDSTRVKQKDAHVVRGMIESGLNVVPTSSAGRLFDAVASLLEVRHVMTYEAQAAAEVETLADSASAVALTPRRYEIPIEVAGGGRAPLVLDTRALIRAVVTDIDAGVDRAAISLSVHHALADAMTTLCSRIRETSRIETVALSGGCFQSRLLTTLAYEKLTTAGFEVLLHRRVPPNDGGIALGQAAIASWQHR